jgi:hypothetical protein
MNSKQREMRNPGSGKVASQAKAWPGGAANALKQDSFRKNRGASPNVKALGTLGNGSNTTQEGEPSKPLQDTVGSTDAGGSREEPAQLRDDEIGEDDSAEADRFSRAELLQEIKVLISPVPLHRQSCRSYPGVACLPGLLSRNAFHPPQARPCRGHQR